MDEYLSQIEAQLGYPTDLIERAAAARAQAMGTTTEEILRQWAGGEAPAPGSAPAPTAAAATPEAAAPAEPAPSTPADTGPTVEVLASADAGTEADDESDDGAAADETDTVADERAEEPVSVLSGFPRWLAAAFLLIPILALGYAALVPDGPDCGISGQLALDPVTGEAENCDGTPYGIEIVNFFTIGRDLYDVRCASCHGTDGGGGAGPALAGGAVVATFPLGQCPNHISWVALGSAAWPDPTYGVLQKPVGGFGANMPGFEGVLTEQEIAAIVLYERVNFGGEALPESLVDCALNEADAVAAGP